ncbi:transglutaminase-like cysteine peptidase [Hoeflea sp.]|uniref:transglutaminase-like cysteine peptidase n=1 Tax=Hoeflea sp. TaxID=1940281 RepID=UPI003BB0F2EE
MPGAVEIDPTITLRFTMRGLEMLGDDVQIHALQAASLKDLVLSARQTSARTEAHHYADQIITAAIPSSEAPKTDEVRPALLASQPLFGAHRIRFGKIRSGARISTLIRKAATSGSEAVCINECARLADRLAIGGSNISRQLQYVSASINQKIAYRTDEQNHGTVDQWSTPNETLGRGSGDCEDYAILKMAVLAHLGVPMNAMEIVVVKDTRRRLFHAVLSVALKDRTVILDNMTDELENDTAKRDYAPLFSLSGTANYIFGYKGGDQNLTASLGNIAAIAPGAGF